MSLTLVDGILNLEYARKSTEDKRQIASIPDQLEIAERLASELDVKVPKDNIFTDKKSAKLPDNRLGFTKMLELIQEALNKKIKIRIFVWHANRLARNGKEGGTLEDFVRWKGLEIYTSDSGNFKEGDETTLHNEFGYSAKNSKETSLGVKRNIDYKLKHGIAPVPTRLGYMFDPMKPQGLKDHIKRSSNWDLCREWIELQLNGQYNIEDSLELMSARGLRNNKGGVISRTKAYEFFADIFNTGNFIFRGEVHKGIHPPLMNMTEFEQIQRQKRAGGNKKRENTDLLPHKGQFKCGCGCGSMFTSDPHWKQYLNGTQGFIGYYKSTRKVKKIKVCKELAIPSKTLVNQVNSYIDEIEIVPELAEILKRELKRQNQTQHLRIQKAQEVQTKQLAEVTRQKFELRQMKNEGFFPDDAEYQKEKTRLLMLEASIKEDIVHTDDSVWDSLFDDLTHFTTKIKAMYNSDDPFIKRTVVDIVGSNLEIKGRKLRIKAKNCFIAVARIKKGLWEKNLWIEPKEGKSEQPKQDHSDLSILLGADERS